MIDLPIFAIDLHPQWLVPDPKTTSPPRILIYNGEYTCSVVIVKVVALQHDRFPEFGETAVFRDQEVAGQVGFQKITSL
jgi:hypothetical protein